jgi:hypothetical protein
MKNKAFSLWFSLLLILPWMAGCSRPATGGDLVGTWSAADGETLQLGKDGTYSSKTPAPNGAGTIAITGTYTKPDATHIEVETKVPQGTRSTLYEFSVSGDELVMHIDGTQIIRKYKRAGN